MIVFELDVIFQKRMARLSRLERCGEHTRSILLQLRGVAFALITSALRTTAPAYYLTAHSR
ncbi:hypothetical protein [Ketogulonicigenium vulgare]|uniref:hypothetical protein n=1 Tax=Ketogulonicigenium vulgare TaxID=92945 RepID=UPI0023584935|nr:hypothetical protein [Ketogulonicigenium vulgare]